MLQLEVCKYIPSLTSRTHARAPHLRMHTYYEQISCSTVHLFRSSRPRSGRRLTCAVGYLLVGRLWRPDAAPALDLDHALAVGELVAGHAGSPAATERGALDHGRHGRLWHLGTAAPEPAVAGRWSVCLAPSAVHLRGKPLARRWPAARPENRPFRVNKPAAVVCFRKPLLTEYRSISPVNKVKKL